ncbi:MAG: sulfatase-like hydrolase/transferase [Spirochaetes bacterium]|nr:sulfatase-like hydrolase/transferase [Spirochaetota bacterium]
MQRNLSALFVNAVVFSGIIALYSLASSFFIPSGVNALFTSYLFRIFSGITVFSAVIFILWKIITRRMAFALEKEFEPFKLTDFAFILLPMTPVTQYILSNQDSVTMQGTVILFAVFVILSAVCGIIFPVCLSKIASKKVAMTASIAFLTMIFNMASLSSMNAWSIKGVFGIQIAVMVLIIIICFIIRFIPVKIAILAMTVFFAVNAVTAVMSDDTEKSPQSKSGEVKEFRVTSVLEGKSIKRRNDILFIIFESYADNETLKYFGYDNENHADYLKSNGFHVYRGIYSLGAPTEQALSKAFNIDRDVSEHKKYLAGNTALHALLSAQGYKTHGVFDNNWNLRGLPMNQLKYDYTFPASSGSMDSEVLLRAIFKGEFSDAVSFEGIDYNSYLEHKKKVIGKIFKEPAFMYSQSSYPGHSPSGKGMSLEEQPKQMSDYLSKIEKANNEMRLDVEEVIKNNPDAIVIFAGDHGPFLTKTGYGVSKGRGGYKAGDLDRYDIQDRFGMFLAIKWPEENLKRKYDIKILQDVFPAVLSYLYEDDSLFDSLRIKRMTKDNHRTLGVYVEDGIIHGGKDDGQKLFLSDDNILKNSE